MMNFFKKLDDENNMVNGKTYDVFPNKCINIKDSVRGQFLKNL